MMALLPEEARSRMKIVSCDFLNKPDLISKTLKSAGVRADHVFFYSYIHKDWSEADALVKSNVSLLRNFLEALELADIKPTRFILQTGGKSYGMHLGRTRTPLLESDPQPRHLWPNFYYLQEDLLKAFCDKNSVSWNVIRPAAVIGTSTQAAMNMFYLFAVYAVVQVHKGEPLFFGGDWEQWQYEYYHCSARMTGYLTEWAALEEPCGNEAFNANDGGPLTYERFFTELARWFGAKGVVPPPDNDSEMVTETVGCGGKGSPLGYGPIMEAKSSFSFYEWAKDEKNVAAWREIMKQSGGKIASNPFDNLESFHTLKWAYQRFGTVCLNKARRYGWTGFVDTMESIFEMYQEMGKLGALPPMQVKSARPLC
ncbi:NAD dependent epimerase/dehydratase [Diaporthe helianthi]|uniref:NAD dependent epimerase/dehydratase n=1 Tax=Diaporthe helianthi TaxID=158607 RepID=A0A2P5HE76_DIAHE|nr:NAD dependent epimerase/dehydratase [Diaporthe helianthi]